MAYCLMLSRFRAVGLGFLPTILVRRIQPAMPERPQKHLRKVELHRPPESEETGAGGSFEGTGVFMFSSNDCILRMAKIIALSVL